MREYLSVEEAGQLIASEVVQYGQSKDWVGTDHIAKDVEKHLAQFNIGYTDPKTGTWTKRRNGTRYFTTLHLMNQAKNKVGSLMASFKK